MATSRRVALITGANSGIGLSVAQRLLQREPTIRLCLACRSTEKAAVARDTLLGETPGADISLLSLDVSSLQSVYAAAKDIKQRFERLDLLYLNAGIMPVSKVKWDYFWKGLFSTRCVHMFTTGDGLLQQVDGTTKDGLKQIFATNLFGHFVLVKELEDKLTSQENSSQIIWTSSSNAKESAFSSDDIQHVKGIEPYSSSKYCSDMVSVALNKRLNQQGVYSHTTNPGLVLTNLTFGICPWWFWYIFTPFLWLVRVFAPSVVLSPYNGSEALHWLSYQKPEAMDPLSKYSSQVSALGQPFSKPVKMKIDLDVADQLYDNLCQMEKELRPQLSRNGVITNGYH